MLNVLPIAAAPFKVYAGDFERKLADKAQSYVPKGCLFQGFFLRRRANGAFSLAVTYFNRDGLQTLTKHEQFNLPEDAIVVSQAKKTTKYGRSYEEIYERL